MATTCKTLIFLQNSDFLGFTCNFLIFFRGYCKILIICSFPRKYSDKTLIFSFSALLVKKFRRRHAFSFLENYLAIICPFQHHNFIILMFLGKTNRFREKCFVPLSLLFSLSRYSVIYCKTLIFTSNDTAKL